MKALNLIPLVFLSICYSCKSQPLQEGAHSKEELTSSFISALSTGEPALIRKYLVRKQEYIEAIHPFTPEAKGTEGGTLWDTMIIRKRDIITSFLVEKFKGKTCSVAITGKERKMERYGDVTFYRQIPVRIVCGDQENLYSDDSNTIFGVVVEKYGTWKVLNIFND